MRSSCVIDLIDFVILTKLQRTETGNGQTHVRTDGQSIAFVTDHAKGVMDRKS